MIIVGRMGELLAFKRYMEGSRDLIDLFYLQKKV